MSYRFKEPGALSPSDSKFGGERLNVNKQSSMDDSRSGFGGRGRRPSPGRDRPREFGYGRDDMPPIRDRSPIRGGFEDRYQDRYKREHDSFSKREELIRKESGRSFMDDPYRDRYAMESRGRYESGGFNSRFDSPEDLLRSRPLNYPSIPLKGYSKSDMVKPNECEIIVVSKHQRGYAETIEARMKNLGIVIDILFLKDEALLVQTIDDIARRGSLFAMVVTPLNETHRSVTLNILYGTPQEHRNMPLDDALKLVARNFHDHIRSQRETMDRDRLERGIYSGSFPADREIQFLLKLLLDGRQLSIAELDTVIRFLTERRDKMKGTVEQASPVSAPLEVKSAMIVPKDDADTAKKEKDLQNRILNIMNQGAASDNVTGVMDIASSLGSSEAAPPNSTMGTLNHPSMSQNRPGSIGSLPHGMSNNQPSGANPQGMGGLDRPGMSIQNQPPMSQNQSSLGLKNQSPAQIGSGANLGPPETSQPSTQSSTYINFDNPSVQKALDSLMQSGPNLLKNISISSNSPSQGIPNNTQAKMPPPNMGPQRVGPGGDMGNMGPQRGGPGGDMGNMGPQRGGPGEMGNMGPQRGGPGDMGNMGPQRGGPADMSNMGSQRCGPADMSNMGSQRGGPADMGNMGPQRGGPGEMGNMGPSRGGQGGEMGNISAQRGGPGSEMGNMGPQRGGSGGEMGSMGPQRGGPGSEMGMGPRGGPGDMGNMGPQRSGPGGEIGNMGPQRGGPGTGNMGPPPGHGMGGPHQGPGMMGPGGPMSGMGPRPFQGQGMFGGGGNMMGNRPPFMGGPMGNQGMGGPRRY